MKYYFENEVRALLTPRIAVNSVRKAFAAIGDGYTQMPPKTYVKNDSGDFRAMPALTAGPDGEFAGVKWVSVFPRNSLVGLPTVQATYLLSSAQSGGLLAVLEANHLTGIRTGAAGALASEIFMPPNPKSKVVISLIGSGKQAEYQALCHQEIYGDGCEFIGWSNDAAGLAKFTGRMMESGIRFAATKDIDSAVEPADIICTCTTAVKPVLELKAIRKNRVHINAIGADAPGKQEIKSDLLKAATVIVDDRVQAAHSGEINVPIHAGEFSEKDIATSLGDFLAKPSEITRVATIRGQKQAHWSKDITVFDSTGLAVQDLYAALACLNIT